VERNNKYNHKYIYTIHNTCTNHWAAHNIQTNEGGIVRLSCNWDKVVFSQLFQKTAALFVSKQNSIVSLRTR